MCKNKATFNTNNKKYHEQSITFDQKRDWKRRKTNLGRDSGADGEEEIPEIAGDGGGQDSERIVRPAGDVAEEGEEEHDRNGEGMLEDLAVEVVVAERQHSVDEDLDKHAGPYPHEGHREIRRQQPPPAASPHVVCGGTEENGGGSGTRRPALRCDVRGTRGEAPDRTCIPALNPIRVSCINSPLLYFIY